MSRSSDVKDVVFCPDCGGVIGATAPNEFGHPCKCFANLKQATGRGQAADPVPARAEADSPATPQAESSPAGAAAEDAGADVGLSDPRQSDPTQPVTQKLCALCGKNVSGHRRVKDSRGYICLDCHRGEIARQKKQGVRCPRCGRVVREESLVEHEGVKVCHRCLREAREAARPGSKKYRRIDDKAFQEKSKTQLFVLLGVALVLAIFMLIGWLSRG